jgi:IclR family transcriptional regulator, acetate operon repressor
MSEVALRQRPASPQAGTSVDGGGRAAARSKPVIQSVDRCFDILEALSLAAGHLSLADLSARVGLNLSTCHHLVATIARRGYIIQDRVTRRYALSSKVFELSEARTRQIDLVGLAMPVLEQVAHDTGEAAQLAVIEGTDLLTVARLNTRHAVRVEGTLSKSNAAHATAIGKAILAWLPEREIDEILAAKGLHHFTHNTITTRDALIEALRLVRRHGYAEDREEFQPNVWCVAAALRGHKGSVAGSIGVSLPLMRASETLVTRVQDAVMTAAAGVSRDLGSRGAPGGRSPDGTT